MISLNLAKERQQTKFKKDPVNKLPIIYDTNINERARKTSANNRNNRFQTLFQRDHFFDPICKYSL